MRAVLTSCRQLVYNVYITYLDYTIHLSIIQTCCAPCVWAASRASGAGQSSPAATRCRTPWTGTAGTRRCSPGWRRSRRLPPPRPPGTRCMKSYLHISLYFHFYFCRLVNGLKPTIPQEAATHDTWLEYLSEDEWQLLETLGVVILQC